MKTQKEEFSIKIGKYNELFTAKHILDVFESHMFTYNSVGDRKIDNYNLMINMVTISNSYIYDSLHVITTKDNQCITLYIEEYNILYKIQILYKQIYKILKSLPSYRSKDVFDNAKECIVTLLNSYMDLKLPISEIENKKQLILKDPNIISINSI